ncbi:MAG: response regulator [Elusimicrobia bacterium]|nr:response regulator [Elusimicrobiota bacterium]
MPAVLVVDDDAAVRGMLCAALSAQGYETLAAGNGREALACLRGQARRPGLILLDLMMPEMNGWEFLRVQREDPDLARIPVAVITVLANLEGRAPELGAVDLLAKPSRIETLMPLVARLCA